MVHIAPLVGAAVFLSGFVAALPTQNYDNSPSNGNNNYGGNSNNNNNNNYGGNSDNNNNNNNSYGGNSNNNYGGNNNYNPPKKETTTMMDDKKTTMMMDDKKTTMMMDDKKTTTMMDDKKTTTMAPPSYQTPSYGSGKSYWGGKGYEDCVNQCIAQFGNGENGGGSYQPGSATAGTAGSKGTGATHTVIVAPSQGVFRMMPFATNASVGDTILFKWGADGHTVTKSSSLTPCNESNSNPVFASGKQNKDFIFTQVVNDTNPTFYYCGVPTHCEKGMFGVINPTMATPSAPNSFALAMAGMATNSSDLSAYMAYTNNITANNLAASTWGQGIDMNQFPDWAKPLAAENIMFTRGTMAKNADIVKPDNTIDLASHATTPLMLPKDLKDALDNSAAAPANSNAAPADANSSAASSASPASSASSPPASSSSAASSDKKSAAVSVSSPRLLVGAVVVVATFFVL